MSNQWLVIGMISSLIGAVLEARLGNGWMTVLGASLFTLNLWMYIESLEGK